MSKGVAKACYGVNNYSGHNVRNKE